VKEWVTVQELMKIHGLPRTTQGINTKAKKENWERRRRQGMKGNTFEYQVSSLPDWIQSAINEEPATPRVADTKQVVSNEEEKQWLQVFRILNKDERSQLLYQIQRHGVTSLFKIETKQTSQTLDERIKAQYGDIPMTVLKTLEMLLSLSDEQQRDILRNYEGKEQASVSSVKDKKRA
jgi:hypothetical protein